MVTKEMVVRLNCNLQGAVAERFLTIKKVKGLEQNTEVVRSLVMAFGVPETFQPVALESGGKVVHSHQKSSGAEKS